MSVKTSFSNLCTALKTLLSKKLDISGGTLTGALTTKDININGRVSQNNVYSRKILGTLDIGPLYKDLDSKYKDGSYHRMWRIRLKPNQYGEGVGRIKVTLKSSWNSFNAVGTISKTINCGYSNSIIHNNVGYYDSLGYWTEKDFRISELIWNDTSNTWEILIWQSRLEGNNEPLVMLEFFGITIDVTVMPVELTQMTSYTAPKASPTGDDKVVNWKDTPVFETPYGKKVATTDIATSSTNGLMSKDDKKKLDGMAAIVVDDSISTTSTNAIQSKAVGLKFQDVDSEISGINSVLNSTADAMNTELSKKVDKVPDKGLSTNDYTTAEKNKLAGIAKGANKTVVDSDISTTSTNPVQSKAVGLKFQDVDSEISGINSTLTAKTAEIAMIVNEYGSKNLVDTSLLSNSTVSGITRKINGDGSITYSGTSTLSNDTFLSLMASQPLKPGTYIFSVTAITSTSYSYQIYKNKVFWKNINITKPIEITESAIYKIGFVLGSKASISNTFKPMLRYAAIKDDTYVPYVMTNRELTEKVADTGWITTRNLKYRKSGYIVALQGSVTPSGSAMSITLGTLPEDCRPSQEINIAQAGADTPSRQIIVQTDGNVVLLFASNCTASHTYAYNGIFMI